MASLWLYHYSKLSVTLASIKRRARDPGEHTAGFAGGAGV